jgi:hypothetical protein|tara:strand:+ start:320 stop:868 length:549 start_codon:yes stop_codon:yes gene_type:complete
MKKVEQFTDLFESLNQSAIGYDQQKDRKNLKYIPDESKTGYAKGNIPTAYAQKTGVPYMPAGISDQEDKKTYGYIYDSEQSKVTPENPEIIVVGLYRTDLVHLQKNIKSDLEEMVDAIEPTSQYPEFGVGKVIHRVVEKDSAFIHKCKALQQVLEIMDKPQYKRKITIAKQRRKKLNLKYGE